MTDLPSAINPSLDEGVNRQLRWASFIRGDRTLQDGGFYGWPPTAIGVKMSIQEFSHKIRRRSQRQSVPITAWAHTSRRAHPLFRTVAEMTDNEALAEHISS